MSIPAAHNARRMTWDAVAPAARDRIAAHLGGAIASAVATTGGFHPGFAGIVTGAGGRRAFVKAYPADGEAFSASLLHDEARVNAALPAGAPAPALLWFEEADAWITLGFEAIDGRTPATLWLGEELALAFAAVTEIASVQPAPGSLPRFSEESTQFVTCWAAAREEGDAAAALAPAGELGVWAARNLDALCELESGAAEATQGDALIHGDLRADNMLIAGDRVWVVDWPYASIGAPWVDLATFLPSVAMQGGGPAADHFAAHPVGREAPRDGVIALVAAVTGYFITAGSRPEPPALEGIRAFQLAQGLHAAEWLRTWVPTLR